MTEDEESKNIRRLDLIYIRRYRNLTESEAKEFDFLKKEFLEIRAKELEKTLKYFEEMNKKHE